MGKKQKAGKKERGKSKKGCVKCVCLDVCMHVRVCVCVCVCVHVFRFYRHLRNKLKPVNKTSSVRVAWLFELLIAHVMFMKAQHE